MSKFVLFTAATLLTAAPALAQTTPAPAPAPAPAAPPQSSASAPSAQMTPPPAFMSAAQAFGGCLRTKAIAAPASATPEAAAHGAVTGCATEKTALDTAFNGWVASPSFPAAGREQAQAQYQAQMAGVEGQIATQLRAARAAPAAPSATPAH